MFLTICKCCVESCRKLICILYIFIGSIRVCDYCWQVAQRFAQKSDSTSDPKVTKEVLRKAYKETDPEGGVKGQRRSTLELMGQLRLRYVF